MNSINDIFNKLKDTNSRLAKEAILEQNKNNETLKKVIFLALSPFSQFFIKKIPSYTSNTEQVNSLDWAILQLEALSSREKTGHAGISHLTYILENVTIEDAKVIERIIAKDLKCGVSDATANKIWPKLIPSYPIMLASGYDEKLIEKAGFPAYTQLKLDGMRFNAIIKNGNVEFFSRNGKQLEIPNEVFHKTFKKLSEFFKGDYVFDGELLVSDDAGKPLPRTTGNGILSKAIKNTMSIEEALLVRATLWDCIPFDKWYLGKWEAPYSDRIKNLSDAITSLKSSSTHGHYIDLVWFKVSDSLYDAQKLFEKFLDQGQEGIILKTMDGIWENTRSKDQIKFKGELECDLQVIDWEVGTGKNKNKLGALVCESSDGKIRVNVGSGYSDVQRDSFNKNIIGNIVTVRYNSRIKEKNSEKESLFLPRFVELRLDKTLADSSKTIK